MTEAEWLASTSPVQMLEVFQGDASERKLRLFEVEYLRHIRHIISPPSKRRHVEIAERRIECGITELVRFSAVYRSLRRLPYMHLIHGDGEFQAHLMVEMLGTHPFRPVAVDPRWLTSTVVALAAGIYEEQAFDRLPILADALMDAGCEHPDILAHCRGDGPHTRGCWVVDLLLGKA